MRTRCRELKEPLRKAAHFFFDLQRKRKASHQHAAGSRCALLRSPVVATATRSEHGDTVMVLRAMHGMCCCVASGCFMGILLRMCILPVLWKVNGLWWSDVKGNTYLFCSCVRFSVFVSNAICSHPLRQFEDLLLVPSRLFFFLPSATGDLERLQSHCPTV